MSYKYKNIKHVVLHGIPPGKTKVFSQPIEGGGIELIENRDKINKGDNK